MSLSESDPAWEVAREAYTRNGAAIFLGAGMSANLRVPTWDTLISRLTQKYLGPENLSTFEALRAAGLSLPAVASLLQTKAGGRQPFQDAVRSALYSEIHDMLGLIDKNPCLEVRDRFLQFVREGNPSLAAAASLCVAIEKGQPAPNPRIHAVVNFNFDDLFTMYLRCTFGSYIVRVTEGASRSAEPFTLINLYHPHGRLSIDRAPTPGNEAPIVFTEQAFFDFYNRPNAVFNYTLLYLFREHTCFFLGSSFRDENLRRLLHYSACERREDYLVKKSHKIAYKPTNHYQNKADADSLRHFAVFCRSDYEGIHHAWTDSLKPLGVRPLWVEDWSEIPGQLGKVYGETWTQVLSYSQPPPNHQFT